MKQIKVPKLALALAVAGAALLSTFADKALAIQIPIQTYTYVFNATDGTNYLNGSSITIQYVNQSYQISSWDILDSLNGESYTTGTVNSSLTSISGDSVTGFIGYFSIDLNAQLTANGIGTEDNGAADSGALALDSLTENIPDPVGVWTAVSPVPDESSTLPLLLGALGVVAGVSSRLRSWSAPRSR